MLASDAYKYVASNEVEPLALPIPAGEAWLRNIVPSLQVRFYKRSTLHFGLRPGFSYADSPVTIANAMYQEIECFRVLHHFLYGP